MIFWKVLCISNIVFNVFASVTLGLAVYKTLKSKKKVQPQYKKYGSK